MIFFSAAFQRAVLQASILYCSACTPEKINIFNVFCEAYAPMEKMYPLWT